LPINVRQAVEPAAVIPSRKTSGRLDSLPYMQAKNALDAWLFLLNRVEDAHMKKAVRLLAIIAVAAAFVPATIATLQGQAQYAPFIRHSRSVDGTGAPWHGADVASRDGTVQTPNVPSTQQQVVLSYLRDVLDGRKIGLLENLFLPDCVIHRPEGTLNGLAGIRGVVARNLAAYSQFETEVQDIIEAGERNSP
jgi:hypothetical protein